MTHSRRPSPRRSAPRRSAPALWRILAAATFLTPAGFVPGSLLSAAAAQLPVVPTPVADPILANLAIPETAPAQGMWSGVRNWPLNAIHMTVLPTGKVLTFGSPLGDPGTQDGRAFDVWDPSRGLADGSHVNFREQAFLNSFCAATTFLADGSLLVAGGIFDGGVDKGSAVLNPAGTAATALTARMANDRYYSTMLSLPDGRPIIMGGSYPYSGGWADPEGSISRGFMTGMTPEVYDGNRWNSLFGANSREAFGPDANRFWYPRAWIAPSGKVFGISSERMWLLDPNGAGSVTSMPFKERPRNAASAIDAPNVGPVSTAVMYDTGKILQVGGNGFDNGNGFLASSRATLVDINGGNPVLSEAAAMRFGRSWANATVLPTGVVAVTGGSLFSDSAGGNTVLASEMWDPRTNAWSLGASNAIYRGYHSSAALLQNGTVLVAGGGAPGPVANLNAEIFYPPYLFTSVNGKAALAPRPQVVSLSANKLAHAQSMQFEVGAQTGIAQVVFVGLSQVTHSFNSGQRRVPATFTQNGTIVTVQTPASGNIAPNGYYQLVAIDGKGVPSAGVIVALGANLAPPSGPPTVPTGPANAVPDASAQAGTWSNCAAENQTCTVANGPKTVRFGANGQYVTKSVTGTTPCTNDAFGRDPIYGVGKVCETLTVAVATGGTTTGGTGGATTGDAGGTGSTGGTATGSAPGGSSPSTQAQSGTWSSCAAENQTCTVPNGPRSVRFGANGQYVTKSVTGSTPCTNDAFGRDPIVGVGKTCEALTAAVATGGTTTDGSGGTTTGSVAVGASPFTQATTGGWNAIGSDALKIASGADGTTVAVSRVDGRVWLYQADGVWRNLPGLLKDVAVVKANSFYGIGLDNVVYRFDGIQWTAIPSANNVTIAAASDGTVVVVNQNKEIWAKPTDDAQANWRRLPGTAQKVVAMNGRSFWAIGLDNNIYRGDGVGAWAYVGRDALDLAATADGGVVTVNRATRQIWRKFGDNTVEAWNLMPNGIANAVTAPNAQRVLAIGPDNKIYRY